MITSCECLCVDIIKVYTLKGNNNIINDFICVTIVDPAIEIFKTLNLLNVDNTGTTNRDFLYDFCQNKQDNHY